jgi:hypothetical protein
MPIKTFTVGSVLTASDVNTYLMNQSVIVCTSSTRPASPVEGMTIYQTDTDNQWFYDGAAWLPTTGMQPIKPTGATNGTVSGHVVTVGNSVGSVTVNGVFSSLYDNYRVHIFGVNGSTGTDMKFTLGATATGYYGSYYYDLWNASSTGTKRFGNAANTEVGGVGTAAEQNAHFDIFNPNKIARTSWSGNWYGNGYSGWFSGVVDNVTSYTSFTLTPVAGTLTGGTIKVYGYR